MASIAMGHRCRRRRSCRWSVRASGAARQDTHPCALTGDPFPRLSFWDHVAGVAFEATRAERGSSTALRSRREAELRLGCLRLQPATIPSAPAGE